MRINLSKIQQLFIGSVGRCLPRLEIIAIAAATAAAAAEQQSSIGAISLLNARHKHKQHRMNSKRQRTLLENETPRSHADDVR